MALLEIKNVGISFGGLRAVDKCNIVLEKGELIGLIGPNGAGKTTVFNMLTGVYLPTEGDIIFEGKSIVGLKPYNITERGIARTFQNIRLFKDLTVLDNVKSYHMHAKHGVISSVLRLLLFKGEQEITEKALECLEVFWFIGQKMSCRGTFPTGNSGDWKLPGL